MKTGYNEKKCQQRNRIAAIRDGVNATPIRFLSNAVLEQDNFVDLSGGFPRTTDAALARINALLPEGATPLTADDVYIHYAEAANQNYVEKYSFYLGPKTMRNITRGADNGVAFMNSHRTGRMSTPSELPFGRTFAGTVAKDKETGFQRAIIGVYMGRDIHPSGDQGPSTDDLHKMIETGTASDVSVGLIGGTATCTVCGNGLDARDDKGRPLCSHYPGTHRNMTADEINAQKAMNEHNRDGVAAFILDDAQFSEVSAVYDGAVPGAGIRKVLSNAKAENLSQDEVRAILLEARTAYQEFFDFDLSEVVQIKPRETKKMKLSQLLTAARNLGRDQEDIDLENDIQPQTELYSEPVVASIEADLKATDDGKVAELQAKVNQLEAERAERLAAESAAQRASFMQLAASKIDPAKMDVVEAHYAACEQAGVQASLVELMTALPVSLALVDVPKEKLQEAVEPQTELAKTVASTVDALNKKNYAAPRAA